MVDRNRRLEPGPFQRPAGRPSGDSPSTPGLLVPTIISVPIKAELHALGAFILRDRIEGLDRYRIRLYMTFLISFLRISRHCFDIVIGGLRAACGAGMIQIW